MSFAAVVLIVNTVIAVVVAAYLVKHRSRSPARPLLITTGAVVVWMTAYAAEITVASLSAKVLWANIQFVGIGIAPAAWLESSRRMVGRRKMGRARIAFHTIVPTIAVVLAFPSDFHNVFRGEPTLYRSMGMVLIDADYRWFHNTLFVPYQYVVYLSGLFVIIESLSEAHRGFRTGYFLLITGMLFPWVGGALYVLAIPPFVNLNPTSLALMVTLSVYLFVLRREHLLDISPIGRSQVFETLQEGVVVLDVRGRIVDINPTAAELLPELRSTDSRDVLGLPFRGLVAEHVPLVLLADGVQESEAAFAIERESGPSYYLVSPTIVTDEAGGTRGRALTITDITRATLLVQSLKAERTNEGSASEPRLNRRDFVRRVEYEIQRSAEFARPLSIALLRLRVGGSEPVRHALERRLEEHCGRIFRLSWLTPDELAVLLPERDEDTARDIVMKSLDDSASLAAVHGGVCRIGLTPEEFLHRVRQAVGD
ncbi:MAG: PAS domain-containing protein [Spirochaetales bacterium]|nr:PAS domain-containing protein [Spirochaetales bacterium]